MKITTNSGSVIELTPAELRQFPLDTDFDAKAEAITDFSERLKARIDKAFTPTKPTRADIVAKAKRDVNDLVERGDDWDQLTNDTDVGTEVYQRYFYKVKFVVNREKRTVVALVDSYKDKPDRGIARCDATDVFNAHIGKAIALRRALGLDVPDEYLHAPKPEGVAVGDVIYYEMEYSPSEMTVIDSKRLIGINERFCDIDSECAKEGKVIDDTDRKEYAE